jgi:thiol-disulfide isomerase/thioredoxin
MKFLKYFLVIFLMASFSCQKDSKQDYVVSLNSNKLHNGMRSYLKVLDEKGQEKVIDTAIAMNNEITFKGSVTNPEIVFLDINGFNGSLMFFLENHDISIEMDTLNLALSKVQGSPLNEELTAFNQQIFEFREEMRPLTVEFREAFRNSDSLRMGEIRDSLNILGQKSIHFPINYAKEHPSSYLSLYIVESQIGRSAQVGYLEVKEAYEQLDSSLKSLPMAKKAEKKLEVERLKFEREKITAIGAKAPDFSALTPGGKELALSEVYSKSKYTIIDFWAAWCGPCRRENPNLVRVYNKYQSKGLDIIGVSLDGQRGQKDPKAAWIKAIEDDKLSWNHVSNLQYFGPIAQKYNVNAIPAMFIVDQNGVIVAKNLRGRALETKMEELLGS